MIKHNKAKILIADDNLDILAGFSELLEIENYQVYTETNGMDAVKSAKSIEPDLILLDINMPGLSGLDACKILRESPETQLTPIVIITGDRDESTLAEAIEAGSDDFITKPPNEIILKSKIASLLNLNRMRIRYHEREKLNYVINNMSDCLIITDALGYSKNFNSASDQLFDISKENYSKTNILEIFKKTFDHLPVSWQDIIDEKHGSFLLTAGKSLNSIFSALSIKYDLVVNPSNGIAEYIFIGKKLNENENSNQLLQNAMDKTRAAEKVKKLFLSNISHEIRTPLNSILGFSNLVEEAVKEYLNSHELSFFDNIKKSGDRLMKTVHEIADISQLEAGSFNLTLKPIELTGLLKNILQKHKNKAHSKEINFSYSSDIEKVMIYGDEYCINEAINNILHNAVKYTEEGSVNMSLQDSIHSTYKLIIEDTGIGMSIEYQKKLFETFSQESDGYSKKYQGIGLGLALTKKFLEMNDIEIDIQSERQKGTTITLIFPKYQHNRSRINGIKKGLVEVAGCIL